MKTAKDDESILRPIVILIIILWVSFLGVMSVLNDKDNQQQKCIKTNQIK